MQELSILILLIIWLVVIGIFLSMIAYLQDRKRTNDLVINEIHERCQAAKRKGKLATEIAKILKENDL